MNKKGFTLLEMVVVVIIISILLLLRRISRRESDEVFGRNTAFDL